VKLRTKTRKHNERRSVVIEGHCDDKPKARADEIAGLIPERVTSGSVPFAAPCCSSARLTMLRIAMVISAMALGLMALYGVALLERLTPA
jgi:hypothetical protein